MPDSNVPVDQLAAGTLADIPAHARERLARMRGTGTQRVLFTGDLSVNEFLLLKETGFEPAGLVMGSSIYHVGYQRGRWSKNEEMQVLTQALYHARELAMTRMEEEADALGADGIIGVRLTVKRHLWGENLLEFMAVGTAIYHGQGVSHRTPHGKPFTSDLSGQDFWTLLRAGYRPLGLVMGNCVYHVAHQGLGSWLNQVGRNCRDAQLHPGTLRRARAVDGAHAGRGGEPAGGGRGRHGHPRAVPRRVGRAHHGVLRGRHGGGAHLGEPPDHAAGPRPQRERIAPMARTSDLSIDEALLLEEVGFDPISFVMGSTFYHIGYQLGSWGQNQEMTQLTQAMWAAREDALRQIVEQAQHFDADGIVGVQLEVDHEGHHAEFIATGTAVKAREGNYRVQYQQGGPVLPFTSNLSGQDFWALLRGGYRPHRLVVGSCVYHVAHQSLGAWLNRVGNNCEMPNFTQALYDARELAMERMQNEAMASGAAGVMGMTLDESSHGWHPHIIECLAVGTAISPTGAGHQHDPITPVLGVRD